MPELLIAKQLDTEMTAPESIPAAIQEQINAYAGEQVPPEQVLVRTARLCNDQVDRSYERFPVAYLERFAETMPGKSLLPGHDRSQVPLGTWLKGEVIRDEQGVHHLQIPFYMDAKSEMGRRVRLGIAKKVSISFRAPERTCDLCGSKYDQAEGCEQGHRKGQTYDGQLCTVTYAGDPGRVEALEGSLVWLACQYGAEVTGAKGIDPWGGHIVAKSEESVMPELDELRAKVAALGDENKALIEKQKALETLAKDGEAYREWLRAEIARKMTAPMVDQADAAKAEAETILRTLATADLETLQAWDKIAQEKFDKAFPPQPQSKQLGEGAVAAPPPGTPPPAPRRFNPFAARR